MNALTRSNLNPQYLLAAIPLREIRDAETGDFTGADEDICRMALVRGFQPLKLKLSLEHPIKFDGLYGFTKKADSIAFFVDQPDQLIDCLKLK